MAGRYVLKILMLGMLLVSNTTFGLSPVAVPDPLKDWQQWVLWNQEWLACPQQQGGQYNAASGHQCVWSGPLQLSLDTKNGRFSVQNRVYATSPVVLPGDRDAWPANVRVDGKPVAVIDEAGLPVIRLTAGNYRISGELQWDKRPQRITLPATTGLLELQLDGQLVPVPAVRDARLWLGEDSTDEVETDSMHIGVGRRIIDDIPTMVETVLEISISGRAREITVPGVLLEDFRPVHVYQTDQGSGYIPVRLWADGSARLQVRRGEFAVHLTARAAGVLNTLTAPANSPATDGREAWALHTRPRHRIAVGSDATPLDPRQSPVSIAYTRWERLPLFALQAGDSLTIEERGRGLRPDEGNHLQLQRTWWLNFAGDGFHLQDQISGDMRHAWRLNLAPPYELASAFDRYRNESLMITRAGEPNTSGFEVRNPQPSLLTDAITTETGALPVNGWSEAMEQVSGWLIVPPGWRLFAAPGAERADNSWWDRWDLLDLFLVLITSAFAFRLAGWTGAILAGIFLALNFHEASNLFTPLLALILLSLAARALPKGALQTITLLLRNLSLVALAGVAVLFAAQQAKLALYPQLEQTGLYGRYQISAPTPAKPADLARRLAAKRPQLVEQEQSVSPSVEESGISTGDEADLDRIKVTGARISTYDVMNQFPENALIQAGAGKPQWSWQRHYLAWSGPVTPEQTFRLVLTPPWLTSALRWLSNALLAALLYTLYKNIPWRLAVKPGKTASTAILLGLMFAVLPVINLQAELPSQELLRELENRLSRGPECGTNCATLSGARIAVQSFSLKMELEWHAAAPVAVPLPIAEQQRWWIGKVTLDGSPVEQLTGFTKPQLLIPGGVHRVVLEGQIDQVDGLKIQFPMAPHSVSIAAEGWTVAGIGRGRLLGDSLQLTRQAKPKEEPDSAPAGNLQLPPFTRLTRTFVLDREWQLQSQVRQWVRGQGSMTVEIPLILGEEVNSSDALVEDGKIVASLAADGSGAGWASRLQPRDSFQLTAPAFDDYAEAWEFTVSPIWNIAFDGIPQALPEQQTDFWKYTFYPRPGESLTVTARRPSAVTGNTLAIDQLEIAEQIGKNQRNLTVSARLRATIGQEHRIQIPADASIRNIMLDGQSLYLRPQDGLLPLVLDPNEHQLQLELTRPLGVDTVSSGSEFNFMADSANLRRTIQLPGNRWVLAAWGPGVGPAILYWSVLAVVVLLAWLLSRFRITPLGFWSWLLLGFGFSLFAWPALIVAAGWLLLIGLVDSRQPPKEHLTYNLRQLLLFGFSLITLLTVIAAIPFSLLSEPNMQITGLGSRAGRLVWVLDRSGGEFPPQHVLSLPQWVYQIVILLWALWLSLALVRWIKWAWGALSKNGVWHSKPKITADSSA